MRVHQMVASLTFGDAIGNETLQMQSVLRAHGVESEIFAESTDSMMLGRARDLSEYPSIAYYRLADVFVCMSEHEGFRAPLLEAFQTGVPVIAYDASAVRETLGGAGLLVHDKRVDEIAELAHMLVTDVEPRKRVVSGQYRALDDVIARDDGKQLMSFVEQISKS